MDIEQFIEDLMKYLEEEKEYAKSNKEKYETIAMKEYYHGQEIEINCIKAYINSYMQVYEKKEINYFDANTWRK